MVVRTGAQGPRHPVRGDVSQASPALCATPDSQLTGERSGVSRLSPATQVDIGLTPTSGAGEQLRGDSARGTTVGA